MATARRLGARQTPNSGAMESAKGDMTLGRFLVEAKSTTVATMALKLDWLAKITQEARARGQSPALTVTFTMGDGSPRRFGSWVLIQEHEFQRLTEPGSEAAVHDLADQPVAAVKPNTKPVCGDCDTPTLCRQADSCQAVGVSLDVISKNGNPSCA